jgi:thymidine phosphorylase
LRDVTATIESYPLIASSIMSKKLAEGIDGLVLDLKTGSGAFMKTEAQAETLGRTMVEIGAAAGVHVRGLITDMNQPLGDFVGNSLEVIECLDVLKGGGPPDLVQLCEELSAHCLLLGGAVPSIEAGRQAYRDAIASGRALQKFRDIVRWQGGRTAVVDDSSLLPQSAFTAPLPAPRGGYVESMNTEAIGTAMCILGAGRETLDSVVDPAVGMRVMKKIGDRVETGEPLAWIYYNNQARFEETRRRLREAYFYSDAPVVRPELIKKVLS